MEGLKDRDQFIVVKELDIGMVGPLGSLSEAAKSYRIPLNGSGALKLITGQPQKIISTAKVVYHACTMPSISGLGAFYEQ